MKYLQPKLLIRHDSFIHRLINPGIPCALKKSGALLYEVRVVIKELS
jgi:hypothetical protein